MRRALLAACCALACGLALAQSGEEVPFITSPDNVTQEMLRIARVAPGDHVIDLGSGDGRIVILAARRFGATGLGVDIDPALVRRSRENARGAGVADRVEFCEQDLFQTDLSRATVITMYLLPDTVNLLKDKFANELKPGTRIVSHDYPLTGWIPEKYVQMDLEDKVQISGVTTTLIYLYVVPAKVAGNWSAKMPPAVSKSPATLSLRQQLTRVSGSLRLDGKDVPLEDVKLRGDRLTFKVAGRKGEYSGQIKGKAIEGTLDGKTAWSATLGS